MTEPEHADPVTTRHALAAPVGSTITRSGAAATVELFAAVVADEGADDVAVTSASCAVRSPGRIAQATSATSRISSSPRANGHRLRRTGGPFDQVEFLGQYAAFAALVTQFPYPMAAGASRTDR
ncbi:hypothetical protein GCM10022376_00730 [Yimella lutea]